MICPECGQQIIDEQYSDWESIEVANVNYWCPHCRSKLCHHLNIGGEVDLDSMIQELLGEE